MKKNLFLLILLNFFIFNSASAYSSDVWRSVNSEIVNIRIVQGIGVKAVGADQKPIPSATVQVTKGSQNWYGYTDEYGRVQLKSITADGNYNLKIYRIGYITVNKTVGLKNYVSQPVDVVLMRQKISFGKWINGLVFTVSEIGKSSIANVVSWFKWF